MKNTKKKRITGSSLWVLVLIGCFLFTGCAIDPATQTEPTQQTDTQPTTTEGTDPTTEATEPTTEATEPTWSDQELADISLVSFRQSLIGTPQTFAAAYLGLAARDDDPALDPVVVMQENAPGLCENLPFLTHIPEENMVGTGGQLFCIVPTDEQATISINGCSWNEELQTMEYVDVMYRSESGDPILLMCNSTEWEPDTQVTIVDSEGNVTVWYPALDDRDSIAPLCNENGESLLLDFSPEISAPELSADLLQDLVGKWELAWTEVEGYRVEATSDSSSIQVTATGDGEYQISYSDNGFPDWNYKNKPLLLSPGEMYPDCGNALWIANVDNPDNTITTHAVTLLSDDTLLLQHSFDMDGMPMVSYGWYRRAA